MGEATAEAAVSALLISQTSSSDYNGVLRPLMVPTPTRDRVFRKTAGYTGKLSCLRAGISTFLPLSIANARTSRRRVARGMITSSM